MGTKTKTEWNADCEDGWSIALEDGYLKVRKGTRTILAGFDSGDGRIIRTEFLEPKDRKCNRTRQKVASILRRYGWL